MYFNTYNMFDARKDKSLDIQWGHFFLMERIAVCDENWQYNNVHLFEGNDALAKHLNKPLEYGLFQTKIFNARILCDKIETFNESDNKMLKDTATKLYPKMLATVLRGIADVTEKDPSIFEAWVREIERVSYRLGKNEKAAEIRTALQLED